MAEFLLLLHEPEKAFDQYSVAQMQAIIQRYQDWSRGLRDRGKLQDGRKLKDDGRLLKKRRNQVVVDGPYTETKEVIGGFFLITASDYEEAVALASNCPHLDYEGRIEIREIDPT